MPPITKLTHSSDMEHITIQELNNCFVRLLPDEGYAIYSLSLKRVMDDVIVNSTEINNFKAVQI